MKRILLGSLPLLLLLLVAWKLAPQQDFSQVEIKSTHVAGSVHMLEGRGGNIGVSSGSDGILIIDDQFAPLADKIKAALGKIGDGKLRFVLNTHFHGDHTGGNPVFGKESTIVAHENVRARLAKGQATRGRQAEPAPPEALPVITFDDDLSLHFNGEEIEVVHFARSHTDGDAAIFFRGSNVVHMGDLFFNGMFPFVDLASGGDVLGLTASIATILEKLPDDVRIIPGHGPLATKQDLAKYHRMLVETTAQVQSAFEKKTSVADAQKEALPAEWKGWSWSFVSTESWIETIYKSLEARRGK